MSETPQRHGGARPDNEHRDGRSFMMGEFEAYFPAGLRYTTNHMWAAEAKGDSRGGRGARFGLTGYAVRLLQDVYFLDWTVEPPSEVVKRAEIGSIESKKAESDLYAPTAGRVIEFNHRVLDDPALINVDIYGEGWLFEMLPADDTDLLDVDAYVQHLEQAWVVAQRTIKGQI